MLYCIHKSLFLSHKRILDGFVFWQEHPNYILIRHLVPNKAIRHWLITHHIT